MANEDLFNEFAEGMKSKIETLLFLNLKSTGYGKTFRPFLIIYKTSGAKEIIFI